MTKTIQGGGGAFAATMLSAGAALAQKCDSGSFGNPCVVPEISAMEGGAALAAMAAIVLTARERRRRAA